MKFSAAWAKRRKFSSFQLSARPPLKMDPCFSFLVSFIFPPSIFFLMLIRLGVGENGKIKMAQIFLRGFSLIFFLSFHTQRKQIFISDCDFYGMILSLHPHIKWHDWMAKWGKRTPGKVISLSRVFVYFYVNAGVEKDKPYSGKCN